MGLRAFIDIESDGLLKAVPARNIRQNTQVWCIGGVDLDTGEGLYWGPAVPEGDPYWTELLGSPTGTLEEGYKALAEADELWAHHGIGYDYPALEMLVPGWKRPKKSYDTLITCKAVWPVDTLIGPDLQTASRLNLSPKEKAQFIKSHSLKAWGIRTGTHKQDYTGGFDAWSPWMANYMMDDIWAGHALLKLTMKRLGWVDPRPDAVVWPELAVEVEMEAARIIFEQEQAGITFDMDAAQRLAAELSNRKAEFDRQLKETFGSWWAYTDPITPTVSRSMVRDDFPNVTIKRYGKTGKELAPYVGPPKEHYTEGAPYTKIERLTFNPSSRDHLGMRLQAVFGWKPKKFGANGKPTVDESVLEEIPEAVMPSEVRSLILDYFVVTKTLAMVANGARSWIGLAEKSEDGKIHGRLDTLGAVTGRGTHSNPNVSQVPAVKKEKIKDEQGVREEVLRGLAGKYGWECRELFIADEDWEQTGVDASSLELILLGHYLALHDGGAFSARVCDPTRDPHAENAEVAGVTRADAKTTIYLKVYGGSAYKLSLDPALIVLPHEVPDLLSYRGLPMMLSNLAKRFDQDFVDKMDDMQKARLAKARKVIVALDEGIDGLKDLMDNVKAAAGRGYLKAFDGRKLHVRKAHAALNALLQSAGAQAVKLWMVLLHRALEARGLVIGVDFKQTMWNHDEFQFTHRPGLGPLIAEEAQRTIKEAGRILKLRGEFRSDAKTGRNWAECH